jgi:hypothetical protein
LVRAWSSSCVCIVTPASCPMWLTVFGSFNQCNLKPATMRGVKSYAMLLCVSTIFYTRAYYIAHQRKHGRHHRLTEKTAVLNSSNRLLRVSQARESILRAKNTKVRLAYFGFNLVARVGHYESTKHSRSHTTTCLGQQVRLRKLSSTLRRRFSRPSNRYVNLDSLGSQSRSVV